LAFEDEVRQLQVERRPSPVGGASRKERERDEGNSTHEKLGGCYTGYVELWLAQGEDSHPEPAAGPAERAQKSERKRAIMIGEV
jgi:hypothetical protein